MHPLLVRGTRLAAVALSFLTLALSGRVAAAATPRVPEVPGLIMTLRAVPGERLALRSALTQRTVPQLEAWKKSGLLSNYSLIFSRYANTGDWDAMTVLTFANEAALARWKAVEASAPSGLSPDVLKLIADIQTAPVDEVRENADGSRNRSGVYVAIPYTYDVGRAEYVDYLDRYVLPQFNGWIGEHALSDYQIFLARYATGRPWGSLIVLEYKDDAALAQRDTITAKVRERLSHDPAWKAIADTKKSVRTEHALTVADELSVSTATAAK